MYDVCIFSHVQLFATPWTIAHQIPLSMGFSRQDYWSGLSFPSLRDLPDPGTEPTSLKSAARRTEYTNWPNMGHVPGDEVIPPPTT